MKRYLFLIVIQIAFLFTAQGQFTYHQKIDFSWFTPMINIADYNLDGYNDILFDQYDTRNDIYYNDSSANFSIINTLNLSFDGPISTYSTDLDNDLDADILSISILGELLLYENINGTIANATTIFPGPGYASAGGSGQLIAATDLDSNGTVDIVSSRAGGFGQMIKHTNIGSLQFQADTISGNSYSQFILADINGNGYKDIITIGGDAFINNLGTFNTVTNITNGSTWGEVVAADIDYDNDLDIITFYTDTIKYLKNDGSGNFTTTIMVNSNVPNIKSVIVGDIDNDGFDDLICSADSLFWYKNDGVGNLSIQSTISTNLNPGFLNIADLDNDNDLDIVLQNGDSTSIFLNNFVMISSITVQGQGGVSGITTIGGSLQIEANILPLDAGNTNITWSVVNGTGSATISTSGLLTATGNRTVTVTATANDRSGVFGSTIITISNQSTSIIDLNTKSVFIYPNPTSDLVNIVLEKKYQNINVIVIDINGKNVLNQNFINEKVINLEMKNLENGVYFIHLKTEHNSSVTRIIKE